MTVVCGRVVWAAGARDRVVDAAADSLVGSMSVVMTLRGAVMPTCGPGSIFSEARTFRQVSGVGTLTVLREITPVCALGGVVSARRPVQADTRVPRRVSRVVQSTRVHVVRWVVLINSLL